MEAVGAELAIGVRIRGRVQGVGFRAWTADRARALGLRGWVRNRFDGSVEAVFAGPGGTVRAMAEACRRGPDGARVDALEETQAGPSDIPAGFEQRPSA